MNAENLNDHFHLDRQLDHDVDRVLRGFAQATPPAHMEQRVLAHIERREQQPTATHPSCSSLLALRPRWAFATATLALGLTTIALITHSHHAPHTIASNTPTAPHAPVIADSSAISTIPRSIGSSPRRAIQQHPPRSTTLVPAGNKPEPLDAATCHCDPIALAEASAPSHPAPPIPITGEERRILRLMRAGQYEQLAQLDPRNLEREMARERDDFNAYFQPSEPLPQPDPPQEGTPQP